MVENDVINPAVFTVAIFTIDAELLPVWIVFKMTLVTGLWQRHRTSGLQMTAATFGIGVLAAEFEVTEFKVVKLRVIPVRYDMTSCALIATNPFMHIVFQMTRFA